MRRNPPSVMDSRVNRRHSNYRLACGLLFVLFAAHSSAAQFDATLYWSKRVEIGTPVAGVVKEVLVDAGQQAGKGDKLLQLDDKVFRARVESAASNLKSMEEHYQEAKREMERAEELYARTVLSDHDLQIAKNKHITALAGRDEARYQLTRARYDLEYSSVRAPFNAIVLQSLAQPGMVVSSELTPQTLLVLAQSDQMLARVSVDEAVLVRLKPGQAASVTVNGASYEGTIKALGLEPVAAGSGKTMYSVDVQFDTKGTMMRAGQSARVDLP